MFFFLYCINAFQKFYYILGNETELNIVPGSKGVLHVPQILQGIGGGALELGNVNS